MSTQDEPTRSKRAAWLSRGRRIFGSWWAPVIVAALSVCTTMLVTTHTRTLAERDRDHQARDVKDRVSDEIRSVFEVYNNVLHHTRAYVFSSEHVGFHEWRSFVRESRLNETHPGVLGFGYVERIEPSEIERLVTEMQSYGVDDFRVWPEPKGDAPLYVVKYDEPESRNREAWGLNAASNAVNKSVYDAAADSGEHQLSSPFVLAQRKELGRLGAIMVAPHYTPSMLLTSVAQRRAAVRGWVAVVIDFEHFFGVESSESWAQARVSLRMSDAQGDLVVVHEDGPDESQFEEPITRYYTLELAGSEMFLELALDRAMLESDLDAYATISCIVGLSASVLLTLIALLISRSRAFAYELADRMTIQLQHSEQEQRGLAQRALAASEAKSVFLANMSHEIRTPMTAIIGYAEMIDEAVGNGANPDALVAPVQRIRSSGEHLLTLINDILDLSKIESGRFEITPSQTDLPEVISQTIATLEGSARVKGIGLTSAFKIPEHAVLDGYRLRQILINLVGNAIKFTYQGSVRLGAQVEHGCLVFRVTDTGIGIKPEMLERIFSPFSQGDESMNRNHQGTGLGLAISRALAQLMGGELTATSTSGRGSEFVLTLPLDQSRAQGQIVTECTAPGEREARQSTRPDQLSGRVLVAEDGPDNQTLIRHHLTRAGLEPEFVENGLLALERIRSGRRYDLIIMDMQMPMMDGYQATKTLREEGCTLPILALTAHAMAHDEQKCLDAGCDAYETKPIKKSRLLTTIASLLQTPRNAAA